MGRFSNKHGFKTYSADPKMRVAQPSIRRSAQAGHGRTLNVHRESKGENIGQNYDWMRGQPTGVPAAARMAGGGNSTAPTQNAPQKPAQKPTGQQKPKQTQQQNDPQASGISAGKATHAVDGKDLTGKFHFDDNSTDYSIEQVIKAQGFDGKPTVTSDAKAFASACQASNFIAKRGVGASNQTTLNAYDQALKSGEFYVKCSGGSAHGYGMYCASVAANGSSAKYGVQNAESTARSYAGGRAKKIYTMTLDKSAKVGDEYTLSSQMKKDREFQKVCNASKMNSWYTQDVGVYAAYKGYDAYIAGSGRYSQNGGSSDYTVILNRSKVIILD